jgi:hypothetical protein
MRGGPLVLKTVWITAQDEDGNTWNLEADEMSLVLKRGGSFRARLRALTPWGKCHAQIVRIAGSD